MNGRLRGLTHWQVTLFCHCSMVRPSLPKKCQLRSIKAQRYTAFIDLHCYVSPTSSSKLKAPLARNGTSKCIFPKLHLLRQGPYVIKEWRRI